MSLWYNPWHNKFYASLSTYAETRQKRVGNVNVTTTLIAVATVTQRMKSPPVAVPAPLGASLKIIPIHRVHLALSQRVRVWRKRRDHPSQERRHGGPARVRRGRVERDVRRRKEESQRVHQERRREEKRNQRPRREVHMCVSQVLTATTCSLLQGPFKHFIVAHWACSVHFSSNVIYQMLESKKLYLILLTCE